MSIIGFRNVEKIAQTSLELVVAGWLPLSTETRSKDWNMTKTQDHTNPVPFSGGPKGAIASRGAHTAARALRRLSETARAALRR